LSEQQCNLHIYSGVTLRRIFGYKWQRVTGGYGKLRSERLSSLHSSSQIKEDEIWRAAHVKELK
jgi:hypothetical protein